MAMAVLRDDLNLHLRLVLLSILTAYTSYRVNATVEEPYLDEIFHIPQAQKHCEGKFTEWDNKITTPPGLYVLSYIYTSAFKILLPVYRYLLANSSFGADHNGMSSSSMASSMASSMMMENKDEQCTKTTACAPENCTVPILRSLNAVGGSLVLPWICYEIYLYVHSPYHQITPPPMRVVEFAQGDPSDIRKGKKTLSPSPSQQLPAGDIISRQMEHESAAAQVGLNVALFPVLYFFNSLFYTDVWSVIFVLLAYRSFLKYSPWKCAMWSAVSITFRQTNVMWSGFFLVLEVARLLKRLRPAMQSAESTSLSMNEVIAKASSGILYDPPIHAAGPLDYLKTAVSMVIASFTHLGAVLLLSFPYLCVVSSFAGFVYYNGGVTMGDKDNHAFSLHPTQILYFFLFTILSSPFLFLPASSSASPLPAILNTAKTFFRDTFGSTSRAGLSFIVVSVITAAVHFFTLTHPFMLADNRHYVFYIWRRTILLHPLAKYAAVPAYFISGYFVLRSLGNKARPVPPLPTNPQISAFTTTTDTISFLIAFTAAMSGTLVLAPLVEFRYFIVSWCFWRLHTVPATVSPKAEEEKDSSVVGAQEQGGLKIVGIDWRILCETLVYMGIHGVTTWVFLNKPFKCENEEGLMRFMW